MTEIDGLCPKSGATRQEDCLPKNSPVQNQIYYKGTIDLVTEADKMSEELILAEISRRYPDHGILSEESAAKNEQATHALDY